MRNLCILLMVVMAGLACSKESARGRLAVYTLSSYQFMPTQCKIDPATVVLSSTPVFDDNDIVRYNKTTYEYTLSSVAALKMTNLPGRTPLAMTVDGEIIFFFVSMPPSMSSTCFESITTSMVPTINTMPLSLGYPWAGATTDDKRNHERVLGVLSAQGKL